jgi:hypothetical protein
MPKAARATGTTTVRSTREVAKRWTPRLTQDGWTPVSDYFLENYHRLKPQVTSVEAMLVIHLMRHKWDERPPRPAFKTLAKRMGLTDTSVRNHARSLEKKKLLVRIKRVAQPNQFDLTPLFGALERLLDEDLASPAVEDDDEY